MINTKLIIFEGIPGSGKTTTSQQLHKYLIENGIHSNIYVEGCKHPIDLPFHAYLSLSEYEALIMNYPEQAQWVKQNSTFEDSYVLMPYKVPEPYPLNPMFIKELSSKEFCYAKEAVVSFDEFKKVFYRRFEQYTAKVLQKNEVTVFESVLFQHQIHDINRLYPNVKDSEIIEHLKMLAHILSALNPVLFYILQRDVRESLKSIAALRSKPKWSSEETIAYYKKRKTLELEAIKNMPFETRVLDNTDKSWGKIFLSILDTLSLNNEG